MLCLCRSSLQPCGPFCICRLEIKRRRTVKQKRTHALMISCVASFCPFRFLAAHVHMLWCCIHRFANWGRSSLTGTTVCFLVHVLVQAKAARCSSLTVFYLCECTLRFSVLAIQQTSPSLVCSEDQQLLSSILSLPQHSLPGSSTLSLSARIFLWMEKGY